jgi:hypothetical protein
MWSLSETSRKKRQKEDEVFFSHLTKYKRTALMTKRTACSLGFIAIIVRPSPDEEMEAGRRR